MWWKNDTQKIPRNIGAGFDSSIAWGKYHGQWCFSGETKFIWCQLSHNTGQAKENKDIVVCLKKKIRITLYYCKRCDVGLCLADCFKKWHTCVRVWDIANCEVTQFKLGFSLNKILLYIVCLYLQNRHDSRLKKKQRVSCLEFRNICNKDYILHLVTK
jgi:hypothetical protein